MKPAMMSGSTLKTNETNDINKSNSVFV